MKKMGLGQTVTALANVGVLIGIILLLIELNQSSTMIRGQTRNEIASEVINLMSQVANNPDLASVWYRATVSPDFRSEVDDLIAPSAC